MVIGVLFMIGELDNCCVILLVGLVVINLCLVCMVLGVDLIEFIVNECVEGDVCVVFGFVFNGIIV